MFAVQYWARQSRRTSFRLLFASIVLAVAAITSVGVFSARLEAALLRDASQMLGGDLVIESKRNVANPVWETPLTQIEGIQLARSVVFPSVVPSDKTDLLVSVKAVSDTYPLAGELILRSAQQEEFKAAEAPPKGEAWVDQGVPGSLGLQLGDEIELGLQTLKVTRLILIEPDRGGGFVNFAPRVMINLDDLDATGLLAEGSRATWRTYIKGPPELIAKATETIQPLLTPVDEIETVEQGRPEVSRTLTRAQDFLAMSAVIGTLVACVGIALVSHLFSREQSRELAILKAIGFAPRSLRRLWLSGLVFLTGAGGLLGAALGWLAHWGLIGLLGSLVGVSLPMAGLAYLPMAAGLAAVLLLGFCAVPAMRALAAPASSVIRQQELKGSRLTLGLTALFGVLTTLAVCLMTISNQALALLLFAGFAGVCLVFGGVFWLLLKALVLAEDRLGFSRGRIAVFRSMSKRAGSLTIQGVSLSMGLTALMILAVVQGDLIDRWNDVVPSNAPNRFVFNIQPDQVEPVFNLLEDTLPEAPAIYPMVRGRLSGINGEIITAESFQSEDARRMVEREFNISFTDFLPEGNKIVAGQWFEEGTELAQVSIETSVAERLNLKLGDELSFDFAGTPLLAEVTSVRDLRWDSMQANFYIIFPPKVLKSFPQTWITAFYAPEPQVSELSRSLVRAYPNVTILDTALLLRQIRDILSKVSQAVQFVFLFTVLAGGLVVAACVLSGARTRTRESAIYRALGASSRQLQWMAFLELVVLGALAGLISALTAQIVGWAISHFVFEFEYMISGWLVLSGCAAGAAVSLAFGSWSVNRVCKAPVMGALRNAAA